MKIEELKNKQWDDESWHYLKGFSQALEKLVAQEQCSYIYDESNNRFHLERNFAYELYFQWKTFLMGGKNPKNLILNAELGKRHHHNGMNCSFPDMVLHGDYTDTTKQIIICEIKSSITVR